MKVIESIYVTIINTLVNAPKTFLLVCFGRYNLCIWCNGNRCGHSSRATRGLRKNTLNIDRTHCSNLSHFYLRRQLLQLFVFLNCFRYLPHISVSGGIITPPQRPGYSCVPVSVDQLIFRVLSPLVFGAELFPDGGYFPSRYFSLSRNGNQLGWC